MSDIHDRPKRRQSRVAERRAARPATVDPAQLYSVQEAMAARCQSGSPFYREVKLGLIKVVKRGRRTLVLGSEIIRRNHEDAVQSAQGAAE